jgi:hypothetical protein
MIKSRRMRWEWHLERIGEIRNADKILVEKSEGRQLGRPRRRRRIISNWI